MKTPLVLFPFLLFFCFACSQNPQKKNETEKTSNLSEELRLLGIFSSEKTNRSYEQTKRFVAQLRENYQTNSLSEDSLSTLFTDILLNEIIPYWYGTHWSFDGHSAEPKKGEIACGYFLSTTLCDMGLNMNKYKFAQQTPENEAKTFAFNQNVLVLEHHTRAEHINALQKNTKEGIYFIGFGDKHVGFLLKRKNNLFLIHSKYENAFGVCIEKPSESNMFSGYSKLYLSPISTNKKLLHKWLLKEEIKVIVK
jgi:hypothetical protein